MIDAETLSTRIKCVREEIGWSQAETARRAEITPAALSQIEGGGRFPSIPVLLKLCKAFGVEIGELLESEIADTDRDDLYRSFYRRFDILGRLEDEDQQRIIDFANRLALPKRQ